MKKKLTQDSQTEARFQHISKEELEQLRVEKAHKTLLKRLEENKDNQNEYILR